MSFAGRPATWREIMEYEVLVTGTQREVDESQLTSYISTSKYRSGLMKVWLEGGAMSVGPMDQDEAVALCKKLKVAGFVCDVCQVTDAATRVRSKKTDARGASLTAGCHCQSLWAASVFERDVALNRSYRGRPSQHGRRRSGRYRILID